MTAINEFPDASISSRVMLKEVMVPQKEKKSARTLWVGGSVEGATFRTMTELGSETGAVVVVVVVEGVVMDGVASI
jgi:hypothetical protein